MKHSLLTMLTASFLAFAMCVVLASCQKQDSGTTAAAGTDTPAADAPAIGTEITFGSYPQAGSEKEPLTWIVLSERGRLS